MDNILDELGLVEGAGIDEWDLKLQEKLGLKIVDLQNSIGEWINKNAEELAQEFVNIAPSGDYGALIEDNDGLASYLKQEAAKPEYWEMAGVVSCADPNMIKFTFDCTIVDDGDTFKGFVFVSKSGKIRHSFAQNQA